MIFTVRSPKLATDRSSDWYRYYAGYSPEFVEDALAALELDPGAIVLDPWNGSGTTTLVAHQRGFSPLGFDANPALIMIARARLLGSEVVESLEPIATDILEHAKGHAGAKLLVEEPLETWLQTDSARQVRSIEWAIQHVLIDHDQYGPLSSAGAMDRVSALAAFFYVALFESVRLELRRFVGSNPTWVKVPEAEQRLRLAPNTLKTGFSTAVRRLAERLGSDLAASAFDPTTAIRQASSLNLPLADESVGGAVTSPPYCTRIDYVVATRPELAVLGFSQDDLRTLREAMVGTPTIDRETPTRLDEWGATATSFLAAVEAHCSHASATYYLKYFTQYFDSLWRSLGELQRVLQPNGRAVIVVQDSYYKELYIDLARMVGDFAEALGWHRIEQTDFAIAKTKAAINPRARSWRASFSAIESALVLGKKT